MLLSNVSSPHQSSARILEVGNSPFEPEIAFDALKRLISALAARPAGQVVN
jgi:hypothetical protein